MRPATIVIRPYDDGWPAEFDELRKARSHTDVTAYYDVKDPVCDLIMAAAERWAADVAWTV